MNRNPRTFRPIYRNPISSVRFSFLSQTKEILTSPVAGAIIAGDGGSARRFLLPSPPPAGHPGAGFKTILSHDKLILSYDKFISSHDKLILSYDKFISSHDKFILSDDKIVLSHDKFILSYGKFILSDDKIVLSDVKMA